MAVLSRAVLIAAASSTTLVLSSGIAHADIDEDAAFLRALHKQGISSSAGDSDLIKIGHLVCDLRSEGYSENALIKMGTLHANGMSDQDEQVLVTSAEAAYCPEYIQ